MSADANIKTIMAAYEAFGRGDVAPQIAAVTDVQSQARVASVARLVERQIPS